MSIIKCPNCSTESDVSVLYCPDCSWKLSAVSVGSNFDSKVGSFHVHNELTSDCVSASFLVQAFRSKARQVLREYVPQPQANGVARRAFEQTVRLLQQVRSPQIITPLDYFEQDSRFYTLEDQAWEIMLLQEMRTRGPYSEREVLEIARDVTNLLKDLRTEHGPVHHGEISTSTLARRKEDGALTLMDFAVLRDATQIIGQNGHSRIANRHLSIHQPIERRGGQISAATDVYTLGAMMIEMLSRRRIEEIYDAKRRKWNLLVLKNTTEGTRILLEAMTISRPKKRLQDPESVFPVLQLINSGQQDFEAKNYSEAIRQWDEAYKKAEASSLKRKITEAESLRALSVTSSSLSMDSIPAVSVSTSQTELPGQIESILVPRPTDDFREGSEAALALIDKGIAEVGEGSPASVPLSLDDAGIPQGANSIQTVLAPKPENSSEDVKTSKPALRQRLWLQIWEHRWVTTILGALASAVVASLVSGVSIGKLVDKPPPVRAVRPMNPEVKVGGTVTVIADIDDTRTLNVVWTCTAGKIVGNDSGHERTITLDATGLTLVAQQIESIVTVTATDQYGKSGTNSAKISIARADFTPRLREIKADKQSVRTGDSVTLTVEGEDSVSQRLDFNWTSEPPMKIDGQGGPSVVLTVDVSPRSGIRSIKVTVNVTNESGVPLHLIKSIDLAVSRNYGRVKKAVSGASATIDMAPDIISLQADKPDVQAGDIVHIDAQVYDKNYDGLVWDWKPSEYIEGSGPNVRLITARIQGERHLTVTLKVTNVHGKSDSSRVQITVRPPAAKKD